MRLLPSSRREAIFAIHDFCRAVDDIADGPAHPEAKLAALAAWRDRIDAVYGRAPMKAQTEDPLGPAPTGDPAGDPAGALTDAIARAIARAVARHALERADFHAILDGMDMDARENLCAPPAVLFDHYVDCVAGAVGRLSAAVFGVPPPLRQPLAGALGPALQITNILRDLEEDGARGRLYLPRELLDSHAVPRASPRAALESPGIERVCGAMAARAREDFARTRQLLDACPSSASRAPRIMKAVYEHLLARLCRRGFAPSRLAEPVRIGKGRLFGLVLRHAV